MRLPPHKLQEMMAKAAADRAARPVRVLRNGRCVKRVADVEAAVSHIADATGKHPEVVFDEIRHNRAVMQDDGDQVEWAVDDKTNHEALGAS